jgi:RNA polymerase sigma factor (sigma-70 family)
LRARKTGTARFATAVVLALTSPAGVSAGSVAAMTRTPEDELLVAELRAVLNARVAKLPERSQRLMSLYYGEDPSLREVSTELEVSYATVRRDHDEALDTLRKEDAPK